MHLPPSAVIQRTIDAALAEDIGRGDITSQLLMPRNHRAKAALVARDELVAAGLPVARQVFLTLSGDFRFETKVEEGARASKNTVLAMLEGPAQELLTAERTALNLLQRMCGVATLTRRYVDAVKGTDAVILDTRKTLPGLRALDKYAVTCGGGQNHRMGLFDMVLIKDNHIAIAGSISEAVKKARAGTDMPVEVECDTLQQVQEALAAKADRIMLDNMSAEMMREAVRLVKRHVPLEASGNVSLENVRQIAETGVQYISVGRLTHSSPAADIGLDVVISS